MGKGKYFWWDKKDVLTTNECLALSGLTKQQMKQILQLFSKYGERSMYTGLFYGIAKGSQPDAQDLRIAKRFREILKTKPSYYYDISWGDDWIRQAACGIAFRITKRILLYVTTGTGKRELKNRNSSLTSDWSWRIANANRPAYGGRDATGHGG